MIKGIPTGIESDTRAVVLFSAGKDSATSLAVAKEIHADVVPLFVDFGTEEAETNFSHAVNFFDSWEDDLEVMSMGDIFFPYLSHEENERSGVLDKMLDREGSVEDDVPYISMRTVGLLAALAIVGDRLDADYLYWSFHQNEPLAALDEGTEALEVGERLVQMTAPPGYDPEFVNPLAECRNGADVIQVGEMYDVDWSQTRSCLRVENGHCWDCVSCRDRIEAFNKAGVVDPLYSGELND